MRDDVVLVRAHRGQPLRRVVTSRGYGLVYVRHPDSKPVENAGGTLGVGFPTADVYRLDDALFGELSSIWNEADSVSDADWGRATPWP